MYNTCPAVIFVMFNTCPALRPGVADRAMFQSSKAIVSKYWNKWFLGREEASKNLEWGRLI